MGRLCVFVPWLVWAGGACGGAPNIHDRRPQVRNDTRQANAAAAGGDGTADTPVSDRTRGAEVSSAPLILDVALHVRGSRTGVLPDGADIASGDRMQVEVVTSRDAHLHVAFCDRNQQIAVYPRTGSILARANEPTFAPSRAKEIVLDNNPGAEALYVIVSQHEADDPRLAAAIAEARPGGEAVDCGRRLRAAMVSDKPKQTPGKVTASHERAQRASVDAPGSQPALPDRGIARPSDAGEKRTPRGGRGAGASPVVVGAEARKHPAPRIERGAYVVFRGVVGVAAGTDDGDDPDGDADPDAIAILRYGLNHIAAPVLPAASPRKP